MKRLTQRAGRATTTHAACLREQRLAIHLNVMDGARCRDRNANSGASGQGDLSLAVVGPQEAANSWVSVAWLSELARRVKSCRLELLVGRSLVAQSRFGSRGERLSGEKVKLLSSQSWLGKSECRSMLPKT